MNKTKKQAPPLHHIAGWYGSIAIISAYSLGSFNILEPDSTVYQLINLTGAAGLFYLAYHLRDDQPCVHDHS